MPAQQDAPYQLSCLTYDQILAHLRALPGDLRHIVERVRAITMLLGDPVWGETPPAHEAVADRVARRYRAAVVVRDLPDPPTDIIFSDGGIVTTADLRRLLEPHFGPLGEVQLQPSRAPATVTWSGIDQHGEIVSGRVVLHARLYKHRVEVWADLLVDNNGSLLRLASVEPRQALADRLRRIGELGRRLILRVRVQTQVPAHSIVGDLVEIVDAAEEE